MVPVASVSGMVLRQTLSYDGKIFHRSLVVDSRRMNFTVAGNSAEKILNYSAYLTPFEELFRKSNCDRFFFVFEVGNGSLIFLSQGGWTLQPPWIKKTGKI